MGGAHSGPGRGAARRPGPLSDEFLRAAAEGYCTNQQQAEAPEDWFEQALAYATEKLRRTAATLSLAATGMGQIAGYTVADYLIQHATRERRYARVPASTWDAAISYIRDPADTARLAESARNRLLYRYAIPLYRHAAEAGNGYAARRLADLLAERSDLDGAMQILRARADAGDRTAAWYLTGLLAERGDLDGATQILYALGDADDEAAASLLANLLARRVTRGDRAWADEDAALILVMLLAEHSDLEGLRARADVGDALAETQLARLLAQRGDDDGVVRRLAAWRITELLVERGDLDGLRARADAGDGVAATELARLLAEGGDLDGLRARVDVGDGAAAQRLPDLLIKHGRNEEAERLRRFGLNPDGSIACA